MVLKLLNASSSRRRRVSLEWHCPVPNLRQGSPGLACRNKQTKNEQPGCLLCHLTDVSLAVGREQLIQMMPQSHSILQCTSSHLSSSRIMSIILRTCTQVVVHRPMHTVVATRARLIETPTTPPEGLNAHPALRMNRQSLRK